MIHTIKNLSKGAERHLTEALDFSKKEKLIEEIKQNGYLKYRDKPTMSPYIMAKWKLDELVEEGVLKVSKKRKGGFLFGKNYLIYELK